MRHRGSRAERRVVSLSREERSQRLTAAFEWPMLIASVLVVPTIAIENAGLGPVWTAVATVLNWLIWIAFLTEFVVLLAVAPNRSAGSLTILSS